MPTRSPLHRPAFMKPRGVAERERKRIIDQHRPSSSERGYDADWQRARAAYLAEHPWCSVWQCRSRATDVDHKLSVRDRPDLRLDPTNFRPFCRSHHSARTAKDQGFARPKDKR